MPTRKQRRRREKERRHEWEYVYVDEEGREVEPPPEEAEEPPSRKENGARSARPAGGRAGGRTSMRKVDPPSWRRVFRRAAIFAPIMFVVVYLLRPKDATIASVIAQTLLLLAFFIPFSYLMDRLMYRNYLRRSGQLPDSRKRR